MFKTIRRKYFLVLALGLLTSIHLSVYGQGEDSESSPAMTFKKVPLKLPKVNTLFSVDKADEGISNPLTQPLFKNYLNGLTVGGFYRGFFYSRHMDQNYDPSAQPDQVLRVGEGQIDPILMLYFAGNMTPNTNFGADISVPNPFLAYRGAGYYKTTDIVQYITVVLRGSFKTKLGTFNMKAGGIEFLSITPFTFGSNTLFNRYSIYERRPWDPVGNIKNRYAGYYYSGTINQDSRFGTQAFKGYILNGFIPSINANVDFFYGKAQPNGGIARADITKPSENVGFRFKKNFKSGNYISLNTFNSYRNSDSVNVHSDVHWNIFTSEYSFSHKGITLTGEFGAGTYQSPTVSENWSGAFMADLVFPKSITKIPVALRYYEIGQYFASNVANFSNTSVSQVTQGYSGGQNLTPGGAPFGGSMDNVGSLSNNRRGAAINFNNIRLGKFSFTTGTQISAELNKLDSNNVIYYSHRINNLVWFRLPNYYPVAGDGTIGPNHRVSVYYRGVSEKVKISDRNADGTPASLKYYNSWDVQLKFKDKVFNKDLYVFYLGTFSSAQSSLSALPVMNDNAYIRSQFHELEAYYQVTPDFILSLYGGLEYIKGNKYTDISTVTGNPRDQIGTAIGYGFDFAISQSTTLFFRQRWFTFEDRSFPNEKFKGSEATVEIKIYW